MLEVRTYSYAELSEMMGTRDPQGICNRLKRWGVVFTKSGRKPDITFQITEITDPFKVFCILDLGCPAQTDFNKMANVFYCILNDEQFRELPDERLELLFARQGQPVSRQTISNYFAYLEKNNLINRTGGDCKYYFAREATLREASQEEYKQAWHEYWQARHEGHTSRTAIAAMCARHGGVARKQTVAVLNAFYLDTYDMLNDMICQRVQAEASSN